MREQTCHPRLPRKFFKDQQIANKTDNQTKKICPLMTRTRRAKQSFMSILVCFHALHIRRVTGLRAPEIGHTHPGQVFISDLIN